MALKDDIADLKKELASLRNEVSELRRFQSWVLGCAAGIGAILAFSAEFVRKKLGLN